MRPKLLGITILVQTFVPHKGVNIRTHTQTLNLLLIICSLNLSGRVTQILEPQPVFTLDRMLVHLRVPSTHTHSCSCSCLKALFLILTNSSIGMLTFIYRYQILIETTLCFTAYLINWQFILTFLFLWIQKSLKHDLESY